MKPFRFCATYKNCHYQTIDMSGIVFADTLEEAQVKVDDEYGGEVSVFEIDNDIIEDKRY